MNRALIKSLIPPILLELHRPPVRAKSAADKGYVGAEAVVSAAEAAGLTVREHCTRLWGMEGEIDRAVDRLVGLGVGQGSNPHIVEIGAGTGMYLDEFLKRLKPQSCEVYETALDWAAWLKRSYPVTVHDADGTSLKQTETGAVDFTYAVGVFVYLPLLISTAYWEECCRVTRPGGFVAFDVFTEACCQEEHLQKWRDKGIVYPVIFPKAYVADFFAARGFELVDSFFRKQGDGRAEWLVFRRT